MVAVFVLSCCIVLLSFFLVASLLAQFSLLTSRSHLLSKQAVAKHASAAEKENDVAERMNEVNFYLHYSDFFHGGGVSIPKAWSIKAPQPGGRGESGEHRVHRERGEKSSARARAPTRASRVNATDLSAMPIESLCLCFQVQSCVCVRLTCHVSRESKQSNRK